MRLFALAFACLVAAPAAAAPPDRDNLGPNHDWFERQEIPDGTHRSCCAYADGHVLEEEDWRIAGGEYQVRIAGTWVTFPNTGQGQPGNTVLGQTGNPMGRPVAWWVGGTGAGAEFYPPQPRCLAPGTVS